MNLFNLRVQKEVSLGGGGARLSLLANVFNLFNDDAVTRFRSDLATSDIYHTPQEVVQPRRLVIGAKLSF